MKQYLPLKPVKQGFKVWVVADSANGYFLDLQVYVGKEDGEREYGLGESVVLCLTEQYRGKQHRVFCDNYFSSPTLFNELLQHGLYACGTVRQDRVGFPEALRNTNLSRGESMFRQSNFLTATVWKDKKPVHIISTLSQPGEVGSVLRKEKDGSRVTVSCPTSILTYTKHMRGVDRGDQLRKYYSVRLKCNKNYKYVFGFLFDVCITNAFILSKLCTHPEPTTRDEGRLKAFRAQLAKALIGEYNSRQRAGRRSSKGAQQPSPPHITFHSPHHHICCIVRHEVLHISSLFP